MGAEVNGCEVAGQPKVAGDHRVAGQQIAEKQNVAQQQTDENGGVDCHFHQQLDSDQVAGYQNVAEQHEQHPVAKKELRTVLFRQKEFKLREPLLEKFFDVHEGEHAVLFNCFVAIFVLSIMATWTQDYQLHGNPLHHFWLIAWNFRQLPQTLLVWLAMFLSALLFPFYGLRLWSQFGSDQLRLLPIFAYLLYQFAFFLFSIRAIFWLNLQGACSFIITCENTRIAMKTHSFFRENLSRKPKISIEKNANEDHRQESADAAEWPSLAHFVLFMFWPTFLYRDSYPRSPTRCWRRVCRHACACLASMYLISVCFSQWVVPHFSALRYPEDIGWRQSLAAIFPSAIPGGICLFLGIFYGLLHSWLSMFAEALRFGDRHFYANWWSSRNMAEYYRNWNLVVHDWLYAYVYRDISLVLGKHWGPPLAQCLVFFLSSAFHEYWFAVSLRLFYPLIFTLYFGFGGVFFLVSRLIKRPYIWNILMWWNLLFGTGIFITFYASEWYARQRCGRVYDDDFVDILVPRSWVCHRTI